MLGAFRSKGPSSAAMCYSDGDGTELPKRAFNSFLFSLPSSPPNASDSFPCLARLTASAAFGGHLVVASLSKENGEMVKEEADAHGKICF